MIEQGTQKHQVLMKILMLIASTLIYLASMQMANTYLARWEVISHPRPGATLHLKSGEVIEGALSSTWAGDTIIVGKDGGVHPMQSAAYLAINKSNQPQGTPWEWILTLSLITTIWGAGCLALIKRQRADSSLSGAHCK
jgi:hypothetical protein